MASLFWSNTVWYILLLLTSLIALAFALVKSRDRRFAAAFTAAAFGFVLYSEAVIVLGLRAYVYHPGISADPFQDTVLGNYFSQFSIASTSALLIAYRARIRWYFAAAAAYFLIDLLFSRLGIYEHRWYKSVFTLIGFAPLLLLIRLWHDRLISSKSRTLYYVTLYFAVSTVNALILTLPLELADIQRYALGLFGDATKDHVLSNILYGICFISVMIIFYKLRIHWLWKALFLALLVIARYGLQTAGIIVLRPGWFLLTSLPDILMKYALLSLFDRFLSRKAAVSCADAP